jgi:hypothetical protein
VFVKLVAEELTIDLRGMRSTTWKRKKLKRGIEADLSYYLDPCENRGVRRGIGKTVAETQRLPQPGPGC